MRIGIMTFPLADNYGAMLQAYALQNELEKKGHFVEQINYRNNFNASVKEKNLQRDLWEILKKIYNYNKIMKRRVKFEEFRKNNLNISEIEYLGDNSLKRVNDKYDTFIVGSDQVWNPNITNYSLAYLLNFASEECNKISYAASIGLKELDSKYMSYMKKYLRLFDAISVREKSAKKYLEKHLENDIYECIDPVFLKTKHEWRELYNNSKLDIKKKYILVYTMEKNDLIEDMAKKLYDLKGYEIFYLAGGREKSHPNGKLLNDIGPLEFLKLIDNAEYILTNSFHGTAFSIIFDKKFLVASHSKLNSRIEDLLTDLGLEHLILREKIDFKEIDQLRYLNSNSLIKLKDKIMRSKEFLEKNI